MITTLEISHYPLRDDYEEDIINFIKELKKKKDITVITNAMSTQVKGEYDVIIPHIFSCLKGVVASGSTSSTVIKLIPRDLPIEGGVIEH